MNAGHRKANIMHVTNLQCHGHESRKQVYAFKGYIFRSTLMLDNPAGFKDEDEYTTANCLRILAPKFQTHRLFLGIISTPRSGIVFTIAHVYPIKRGMKFIMVREDEWRAMAEVDIRNMIGLFVRVNGERLRLADAPGWMFVLAAAVAGNSR
ncbi:hypothetical protein BDZ45DRAFT_741309 [Acephala macrosclerotiorum]|nr:hypothetical protein BDZ45DRAFT_741309 [Acephala macrosclerotiorum]